MTTVNWLRTPALWAVPVGLLWGAFQLFGEHIQVCPPVGSGSSCRYEGLVAAQADGISPAPLPYIVLCTLAPLLGVAGVRVATELKRRGLLLIALAMIVEFSSVLVFQMAPPQYNPTGMNWNPSGLLSGNFGFAYACGALLLFQFRLIWSPGPAPVAPGLSPPDVGLHVGAPNGVERARLLAIVVSLVAIALIMIDLMGLGFIGYKYESSDLNRIRSLMALGLVAVVGFDLTVVLGASRHWRRQYVIPVAAAWLIIASVALVVAGTTGY